MSYPDGTIAEGEADLALLLKQVDQAMYESGSQPRRPARPKRPSRHQGQTVRTVNDIARWLERQIPQLERKRVITSAEAERLLRSTERLRWEARQLSTSDRTKSQALLRKARSYKQLPDSLRRQADKGRSTHGLKLISKFSVSPPQIRVHEHEAARISFVLKPKARSITCIVFQDEQRENTSFRNLPFHKAKSRYQAAIWDGTFDGGRNRPPITGTYRVILMVSDDKGHTEMVYDQIRVLNPQRKTVLPRTNSGLALRSLRFDGSHVELADAGGNIIRARALSGLKPNNPKNSSRIDYTKPAYQWEKDKGPLPESKHTPSGTYTIRENSVQHPNVQRGVLQYSIHGTARAWGPIRAPLYPFDLKHRSGFFLHLDVKNDGTAGCIGVNREDEGKFNQIMALIGHMSNQNLPVIVEYP